MFCKNCGQQVPDGTAFCPSCGTKVEAPAAAAPAASAPAASAKSKLPVKLPVLIGAAAVVVLVVVIVVAALVSGGARGTLKKYLKTQLALNEQSFEASRELDFAESKSDLKALGIYEEDSYVKKFDYDYDIKSVKTFKDGDKAFDGCIKILEEKYEDAGFDKVTKIAIAKVTRENKCKYANGEYTNEKASDRKTTYEYLMIKIGGDWKIFDYHRFDSEDTFEDQLKEAAQSSKDDDDEE